MFVSIFSVDKEGLKKLASTLNSSGLVYPTYGMYMIQANIADRSELSLCYTFRNEALATSFCARNPGEFGAVIFN